MLDPSRLHLFLIWLNLFCSFSVQEAGKSDRKAMEVRGIELARWTVGTYGVEKEKGGEEGTYDRLLPTIL